jgi:hypothetical protein
MIVVVAANVVKIKGPNYQRIIAILLQIAGIKRVQYVFLTKQLPNAFTSKYTFRPVILVIRISFHSSVILIPLILKYSPSGSIPLNRRQVCGPIHDSATILAAPHQEPQILKQRPAARLAETTCHKTCCLQRPSSVRTNDEQKSV